MNVQYPYFVVINSVDSAPVIVDAFASDKVCKHHHISKSAAAKCAKDLTMKHGGSWNVYVLEHITGGYFTEYVHRLPRSWEEVKGDLDHGEEFGLHGCERIPDMTTTTSIDIAATIFGVKRLNSSKNGNPRLRLSCKVPIEDFWTLPAPLRTTRLAHIAVFDLDTKPDASFVYGLPSDFVYRNVVLRIVGNKKPLVIDIIDPVTNDTIR